ncbi:MAG: hypothetical protein WBN40_09245 [Pseudomonadales bacterium]
MARWEPKRGSGTNYTQMALDRGLSGEDLFTAAREFAQLLLVGPEQACAVVEQRNLRVSLVGEGPGIFVAAVPHKPSAVALAESIQQWLACDGYSAWILQIMCVSWFWNSVGQRLGAHDILWSG